MARKRYLKKTPLKEARELFLERIDPCTLENETVPVHAALNRITCEPIFAKISSPHYHSAAMDGICVRAEDTFGVTEFAPKRLNLASTESTPENSYGYVDTGRFSQENAPQRGSGTFSGENRPVYPGERNCSRPRCTQSDHV